MTTSLVNDPFQQRPRTHGGNRRRARSFSINFYVYRGHAPLGKEPLGTEGKSIWRDLTTVRGAIDRADKLFGKGNYSLYTFHNFYDAKTFGRVI